MSLLMSVNREAFNQSSRSLFSAGPNAEFQTSGTTYRSVEMHGLVLFVRGIGQVYERKEFVEWDDGCIK